jgi:ABC-type antimicrobial peptide transport system permease subunit
MTLILREGIWRTLNGLFIGVAGAFLLTRFMTSLLFEVRPADPKAYLAVSILLLLVATIAGYLPARRAANVDPAIALRAE